MTPFADASQESWITFDVTVVAPVCIINNNKPIDVDFGSDVKISHIGQVDYKLTPLTFSLQCETPGNYSLVVQGVGAAFESQVLSTNKADLGLEFIHQNKRLPVNKALSFSYPALPLLYVRPVIGKGTKPLAGDFSATASMRVSYD